MTDPSCTPENRASPTSREWLRGFILEQFVAHHIRITPIDLERLITSKNRAIRRHEIRSALKEMINEGCLDYCCHNAVTCVELNRLKLLQSCGRIAVGPPGLRNANIGDRIFISLAAGASFGAGNHPTTQLCLTGLDFALNFWEKQFSTTATTALDIGTGTGVLAIAAALLGVKKVTATDIDSVARFEARQNIAENSLAPEHVTVVDAPPHALRPRKFDLLLANLRPPTLKCLFGEMLNITAPNGIWVVSGFRPPEAEWMRNSSAAKKGRIVWCENLKNWGAMAIQWP
jgi:ribosomal protein L11 methyltransferase